MNTYLSITNSAKLKTIVDQLLGSEYNSYPMLDEGFVAMWASRMPSGSEAGYYALPVDNWILNAIDACNDACSQVGGFYTPKSADEMQFMREYLVEQFSAHLRRYSRGRKLVVKEFRESEIGFRWDEYR